LLRFWGGVVRVLRRGPPPVGGGPAAAPAPPPDPPVLEHILVTDLALHGRLRMRCWTVGDCRPSLYSEEMKLGNFQGQQKPTDHATSRGLAAQQRARGGRPTASSNSWGRPARGLAGDYKGEPKGGASGQWQGGQAEDGTPLPYEVPPPQHIAGLREAGEELHDLYESLGITGGGGGQFLGLRIDQVMHALVDGTMVATVSEPILALFEVACNDVLAPVADSLAVLSVECGFACEKVTAIVQQLLLHRAAYASLKAELRPLLLVLVEVYETVRQCEADMVLALHLTEPEYPVTLKASLQGELVERLCLILWRFSTEALKLELHLQAVAPPAASAAALQMQVAAHLARAVKRRRNDSSWFRWRL